MISFPMFSHAALVMHEIVSGNKADPAGGGGGRVPGAPIPHKEGKNVAYIYVHAATTFKYLTATWTDRTLFLPPFCNYTDFTFLFAFLGPCHRNGQA